MALRRARPMLIAPLIPLWGMVAFWGSEQLHGTRYLPVFVAVMALLLAGLFGFVANKAWRAKRMRKGR